MRFFNSSHEALFIQASLEIEKAINDPQLKMIRATETRWLPHQMAVHALRSSIKSVKLITEQKATSLLQLHLVYLSNQVDILSLNCGEGKNHLIAKHLIIKAYMPTLFISTVN